MNYEDLDFLIVRIGEQMKRHRIALMIALILLAATASMTVFGSDLIAAPVRMQDSFTLAAVAQDSAVQQVLQHATVIVRAQVIEVSSNWSEDHSQIHSQSRLKIHYVLRGAIDDSAIIHTVGGYLPDENLSMIASGMPTLSQGEEVILLLVRRDTMYEIVAGHDGKYLIDNGQVHHSGLLYVESLDNFFARLGQLDATITIPTDWRQKEDAIDHASAVSPSDFVYNGRKWATNTVEFKVNLNSTQMGGDSGTIDDFLRTIQRAAETWTTVEEADFSLIYAGTTNTAISAYNGSNDIYFEDRGQVDENGVRQPLGVSTVWYRNGIILDADIWINDAYAWDTTGWPEWSEIDLESVVLHEVGHWLSLGHDPDSRSVMYYAIMSGSLRRTLFENDRNGIAFIYPCGTDDGCNPGQPITSTPTVIPSPTPMPTFTPTPTLTQTPIPTPTPLAIIVTQEEGGALAFSPASDWFVSLIVPPHAVLTDTIVSFEQAEVTLAPPDSYRPVLGYFGITAGPTGMDRVIVTFQKPATLTIGYSVTETYTQLADAFHLMILNDTDNTWEELACTHQQIGASAHRVTTSIYPPTTFGLFRVENRLYLPAVTR